MLLETLFPDYYTKPNYSRQHVSYNLVKLSDTQFQLEFNVAGMSESELNIEVQGNKLMVSGNPKVKDERDYIVNNVVPVPFNIEFSLKEKVEVNKAEFKNGILAITLELIVPEEKKPKKIFITH